nr:WYL domain-containing protein [Marinicella sp. W31]MDC2878250.1 WYL domain-containing protein [Marinicella sp. W31]
MYLAQLQTEPLTGIIEDSWLAAVPAFDMMPVPHRSVRVDVLRKLVGAIRGRRALKIKYQSMNTTRPDPEWRSISPHAFGHDGLRWHVRAFCHIDRKFKDFILSRCLDSGDVEEALATSSSDRLWHEFVDVILTANPALSDSQRAVIEQDYEMIEEP